ncbi:MAG: hypothetical protein RQ855_05035 [Desulfurococcales archaeon]|jgi:hypothetical protein|nr:hypothetical protein [Desulfurococcales archaeon]
MLLLNKKQPAQCCERLLMLAPRTRRRSCVERRMSQIATWYIAMVGLPITENPVDIHRPTIDTVWENGGS